MLNKQLKITLILFLFSFGGISQHCEIQIAGTVKDKATSSPLSYVNVTLQEAGTGTMTDEYGQFNLLKICSGEYHVIISHIGCEPQKLHLHIQSDTTLHFVLEHTPTSLDAVTIKGSSSTNTILASSTIRKQAIEDNLADNFSNLLEAETGVHVLKNGTGISKPVVHGLYGNRLTILNNGIPQSGQQWGNDHSPEIDPMVANKITILKGTAAIEYGGGNMGSLILLEPSKISNEPHLHGRIGYSFESNGRGNNFNLQLQQKASFAAWKITGTLKKYGDRKTSQYYLNNTGIQEVNLAIQLEKSWKEKYFFDIYASTFNTELGVLRGSHISNLTDLEEALTREIPFFTEQKFSHTIEAPKQKVNHHFMKLQLKNFLNENQFVQFILSGQINQRKEFDIRRSERSEIPALSLTQFSYFTDLKYQSEFQNDLILKIGNQTSVTDNTNNPETDILPLIPDYFSIKSGLYTTLSKEWNIVSLNAGLRYDFEIQNVKTISNTIPREIIEYQNTFNNIGATLGLIYNVTNKQSISVSSGYTRRNPAVNELYSNGLHQGVSGIETGDPNLSIEKSVKSSIGYKIQPSSNFTFESLIYEQRFQDYIYLQPKEEVQLTIRGAFPLFQYEQTNAKIYGLDLSTQFTLGNSLLAHWKYSYIRGNDTSRNIPLVNIPPNSLHGKIAYRVQNTFSFDKNKIEAIEFELNNRFVARQNNLLPSQDFVSPPDAYHLLGFKVSANLLLPSFKIRFLIKIENLLDATYRDYLNRQRYFADDLGRSIILGINFKF